MLLKSCQSPQVPCKRKGSSNSRQQQLTTAGTMKLMGVAAVGVTIPRVQRKVVRIATKRHSSGKRLSIPVAAFDPCDSSSDSGLGLENHHDLVSTASLVKRKRTEIKMESDDANDNFAFEEAINRAKRDPQKAQLLPLPRLPPPCPRRRIVASPSLLVSQLLGMNQHKPHLQITSQPEQQHRARYQTEGSRGAVKDRTGNGFPIVKLVGYVGPATLQVFIGSDAGRVEPHMFYQACRVSGKNSTPCSERLIDGTVVIEVEVDPTKDMTVTCDCVGILKERNVDVEHRFPDQSASRNKKKSTRCRMVFRALIPNPDGTKHTLEVTSQSIVCTQPPGVPEICKKSLGTAPCSGGQELFILGKNFLKDTRVIFASTEDKPLWQVAVQPDKEFLQQSHLVCVVPPYARSDITSPVTVCVSVTSSGKTSEAHTFQYAPAEQPQVGHQKEVQSFGNSVQSSSKHSTSESLGLLQCGAVLRPVKTQYLLVQATKGDGKESVFLWKPPISSADQKLMPPPVVASSSPLSPPDNKTLATQLQGIDLTIASPLADALKKITCPDKRSSVCSPPAQPSPTAIAVATEADLSGYTKCYTSDQTLPATTNPTATSSVPTAATADLLSPTKDFTSEMAEVAPTRPMATGADLSSTQSPSLDTLRRFVSSNNLSAPLPSLSVEKFLSGLDSVDKKNSPKAVTEDKTNFIPFSDYQSSFHQENSFQDKEMSVSSSGVPSTLTSAVKAELQYTSHQDISSVFQTQSNTTKHFISESSNHSMSSSQGSNYHNDTPLNSFVSVANECSSSAYEDGITRAHMALHCQPVTTTTITTANALDYHNMSTESSNHLESSEISATQNARLDALVTSAMRAGEPELPQSNAAILEVFVQSADEHLMTSNVTLAPGDGLLRSLSTPNALFSQNTFTLGNNLLVSPHSVNQQVVPSTGDSLETVASVLTYHSESSMHSSNHAVEETAMMNCSPSFLSSPELSSSPTGINDRCRSDLTVQSNSQGTNILTCNSPAFANTIAVKSILFQSAAASVVSGRPVDSMYDPRDEARMGMKNLITNERLITPETVRLDALVNSALDNHSSSNLDSKSSELSTYPLMDTILQPGEPQYSVESRNGASDSIMMIPQYGLGSNVLANDVSMMLSTSNVASNINVMMNTSSVLNDARLIMNTNSVAKDVNMIMTTDSVANDANMIMTTDSVANDANMIMNMNSCANNVNMIMDTNSGANNVNMIMDTNSGANNVNMIMDTNSGANNVNMIMNTNSVANNVNMIMNTNTVANDVNMIMNTNSVANNIMLIPRLNTDADHVLTVTPHYTQGPINGASNISLKHILTSEARKVQSDASQQKREESMVSRELTQMSDNDLISYINPSCFDTV